MNGHIIAFGATSRNEAIRSNRHDQGRHRNWFVVFRSEGLNLSLREMSAGARQFRQSVHG